MTVSVEFGSEQHLAKIESNSKVRQNIILKGEVIVNKKYVNKETSYIPY